MPAQEAGHAVSSFTLPLIVGLVAGFLGAIPPGPLNVNIIRKAGRGQVREAFRVGFGGALVDALICGGIGLGFGWMLERVVTHRWVKASLALFLVAYGIRVVIRERRESKGEDGEEKTPEPEAEEKTSWFKLPVLVGLLQGAANPTLIVNWTFLITFLVGHGLLRPGVTPAAGFAIGVGAGVFAWFALLIELLEHLSDHPVGEWLRRSTVYAGVLLILFGLYFTLKTFVEA